MRSTLLLASLLAVVLPIISASPAHTLAARTPPTVVPSFTVKGGTYAEPKCIIDDQTQRVLSHEAFPKPVTAQNCMDACVLQNYTFAGMENGGARCSCDYNIEVPDAKIADMFECQKGCSGDSSVACGRLSRLLMYTYQY